MVTTALHGELPFSAVRRV